MRNCAAPVSQGLKADIRASPAVHADETGWRIRTASAWLWDFVTRRTTVYLIRRNRGHEVVEEVLGPAFPGTLISDRLPTYDAVLASLAATCRQRGEPFTDLAVSLLCPDLPPPVTTLLPAAVTS